MADLKGKKVMVTGGAGFIGYHLCHKLSQLTDDLTIYDNLSSGKLENVKDNPKAKFVEQGHGMVSAVSDEQDREI